MQVVGFNFSKISIEKKKDATGKVSINSNIDIENIEKAKIDVFKGQSNLKIDFKFTIKYEPEIADLEFKGSIIILVSSKEEKDLLKKTKKKTLDDKYRIPLFNLILTKSSIKALQLEEDIQLPTHIPFPRINPNSNQARYAG